jgi:hypothetical protein
VVWQATDRVRQIQIGVVLYPVVVASKFREATKTRAKEGGGKEIPVNMKN